MSLSRRLTALETAMAPPEPGGRVWLDDLHTCEIIGASWCEGQNSKQFDRLPGETIEELQARCVNESRKYPGGVVFIPSYGTKTVPSRCDGPSVATVLEGCRVSN